MHYHHPGLARPIGAQLLVSRGSKKQVNVSQRGQFSHAVLP